MVEYSEIQAAGRRIASLIHHTPVITNRTINTIVDAEVFFKCENLQKVGAFKARGACNAVYKLDAKTGKKGVATHSSGNHAQALAYAASMRGFPCTVVMPDTSPAVKIDAVRGYGARVVFCENTLQARIAALDEVVGNTGSYIVHPFDNDDVIAGQGTACMELMLAVGRLDVMVAPVGGGGLMSGTSIAAKAIQPEIDVVGAEPLLANDAEESVLTGKIQPPKPPLSIADGLRTSLCERTFGYITKNSVRILTCKENEIVEAQRLFVERTKLLAEPSGSVPLACILAHKDQFAGKRIGVIVSGGNASIPYLCDPPKVWKSDV